MLPGPHNVVQETDFNPNFYFLFGMLLLVSSGWDGFATFHRGDLAGLASNQSLLCRSLLQVGLVLLSITFIITVLIMTMMIVMTCIT